MQHLNINLSPKYELNTTKFQFNFSETPELKKHTLILVQQLNFVVILEYHSSKLIKLLFHIH